MKALIRTMTVLCLALVLPAQGAFAQERPVQERPAQDRPAFPQEQLDQMLAPIALHPDPLLSQILMAATYPLEVVQAARWSRANPGLKGEAAVKAVESKDWDPSVKSLVAFPEILAMMNEHLEWTEHLGEAFLAQQAQVMDTIQGLRRRAEEAGNLEPNERRAVRRDDEHIIIDPPEPGVVYVPYYDPRIVYGPWWWPAYPPVYWGPPLGYYAGWGPGFWWGGGVFVSSGFFFGAFSWPHRHVTIVHFNHHRALFARRGYVVTARGPVVWRHDIYHRRGVPYRQAVLRQEFRQTRASRVETRRESTAPATRSAPTEQRTRDRRSEQRVDPAPRQPRQDAQRSTTGRADAPASRPAETRRGADAPPRRQEPERREGTRERGSRRDGAAVPRFQENRERRSFARPRDDRPVARAERQREMEVTAARSRQARQQERAAAERARHARPEERRAARMREQAAAERFREARQEQRAARHEEARAERAAARSQSVQEERRGGRESRAERDGRERGRS
jgi:hypothetical protein